MACRDCFRGGIHTHATPAGHMTTIHGVSCYVTTAETTPSPSKILYLCDGFGLALINNKLLADRYAADTGFDVIAPNVPPGGGLSISALALTDTIGDPVAWWDVLGQLKRVWAVMRLIVVAVPFIIKSRQRTPTAGKMIELTRKLKEDLEKQGQDGKLGVAGFCYGGWLATKICNAPSTAAEGGKGTKLVDAAFTAHPSWLKTPDEIVDAVKNGVPYSAALADKDMTLPLEKAEEIEAALRRLEGKVRDHDYEVKIYRGNIPHGFAVRAREGVKEQIEAEREACEQAVRWFKEHLS